MFHGNRVFDPSLLHITIPQTASSLPPPPALPSLPSKRPLHLLPIGPPTPPPPTPQPPALCPVAKHLNALNKDRGLIQRSMVKRPYLSGIYHVLSREREGTEFTLGLQRCRGSKSDVRDTSLCIVMSCRLIERTERFAHLEERAHSSSKSEVSV